MLKRGVSSIHEREGEKTQRVRFPLFSSAGFDHSFAGPICHRKRKNNVVFCRQDVGKLSTNRSGWYYNVRDGNHGWDREELTFYADDVDLK